MKKTLLITMIALISCGLACKGKHSLLDDPTGKALAGAFAQSSGPDGDDALSATTNQSDKDEIKAPKLNAFEGAAFIRPPRINNYGTVALSYNIEVPPGRAGMQPGVGLTYSSSAGDGLAGIGWSLSTGLGVISRTASHGEIYYDYRDTFTYNGKRLVKVGGSAYSENGTYRCEIESDFSRFELTGSEQGGVWRMYDKSGTITVFGQDTASRVYRPDDESRTYIWNFSRSTDLNGNYRYALYDTSDYDLNHIVYLKEIRYTGNMTTGDPAKQYVRFTYKARGDTYVSRAPGFIMKMDRLLDEIIVGWDDPSGSSSTDLWKYTLVYDESEDSHRPVLSTVNSTRHSTSPSFTYRPADHGFVWQNVSNVRFNDPEVNPESTQYFEGDFNGDGISDLVFFNPETGDWQAAEGVPGGGYTHKTYGSMFRGYDLPSKIQFFKGNVTGDYNGDGRSDVAFYLPRTREFWVAEHNGRTFDFCCYGKLSIDVDIFKCEWFTGDFDGNGLSDAVLFYEPTGEWFLMRNMGGRFEFMKFSGHFRNLFRDDYRPDNNMDSASTTDLSDYGKDRGRVHFFNGDYNGDGRTDIAIYDERSGRWWVGENYRINQQPGFRITWVLYREFTAPEQALFANDRSSGDFNGDGLSDFMLFNRETGAWTIGETGDRNITFRTFSRTPQFREITRWLQGDFNGDGRTDIGFYSKTDGNFWIGETTPDGFRYRVYNNLSYCPDAERILGSAPLPRDEVKLESRNAAVADVVSTWLVDYEFDGNYEPDGGELAFAGQFMPDKKPGILIYRKGEKKLYYADGSGNPVVKNENIDLGDPGIRILNGGKADRYGDEDGIAYYQKSSSLFMSTSHRVSLLSNQGGFLPLTVADFDGSTVSDFDIDMSYYFLDRFCGNTNKHLFLLDDKASTPAFVLFRNGTASRLAINGGVLDAGYFSNLRVKKGSVFMMSGDFSGTGQAQVLLVDTTGTDHRWYLGTAGGSMSFARLAGVPRFATSDFQSYRVIPGAGSSTLVYVTTSNGLETFHRVGISPVSGASDLSAYTMPGGKTFKSQYDHEGNPVVYDSEGAKKVILAESRLVPLVGTAIRIARPDLRTRAYAFRWIQGDYNGDGKTDLGFFHLKEPNWYFAVTTGTVPDLMSELENGIGGRYEFEYANSTTMDNSDDDGIPRLPMNYKVCTGLTIHDGRGRRVTTHYSYSRGYAFSAFINGYKETDYFGFGEFTVTDATGARTVQKYHNVPFEDFRKNRSLAGAVREYRFIGSDNVEYSRTEYEYLLHEIVPMGAPLKPDLIGGTPEEALAAKSFIVEPMEVRSYKQGVLVETKSSSMELTSAKYEMTGRKESVTDHFQDGAHRPVTVTAYSKFDNMESTNEMRIDYTKAFESSDHETTTSYSYDSRGNVTREAVRYTGSGLPAAADRIMEYEYDEYGNRVRTTNASGSPARVTEKSFDGLLHQFVTEERAIGDTLILKTGYEVNYTSAFGALNKKTDPNGNANYFEYDDKGRLVREKIDDDSGIETLQEYAYDTNFPVSAKVTQFTGNGGNTIETRVFADGMGRAIHSVRSADGGRGKRYIKTGMIVYDAAGRIIRKSQTDWAADGEIDSFMPGMSEKHPTCTAYDAAGRVGKIILPEGYKGEGETSVSYTYNDPWETVETHSIGRSKRTVKNARGLVLYVEDAGTGDDGRNINASIGFAYDIAGNRVKKMDLSVTLDSDPALTDVPSSLFVPGVKDTSGNNIACWQYNAFGQMTESSDPDLGYTRVEYSSFGEASSRTDALGRVTTFTYDRLGRLKEKGLPGNEGVVHYRYDNLAGSGNGLGRMVCMDDPAQRKEFSYDKIGRVKSESRVIKGAGKTKYMTDYAYDLLSRKTKITYPEDPITKERMTASYTYCPMGVKSLSVSGSEVSKNIIESISYNEFGQMAEVRRGNGTVTSYNYDIKGRMESLLTTASHNGRTWKVQDVKYWFKVDNRIASLENNPDVAADGACQTNVKYEYQYDGLNRLVHARGSYEKLPTGTISPPDPLSHGEGGGVSKKFELGYDYAPNGNLMAKTIYNADTGAVDDQWHYTYNNHAVTGITASRSSAGHTMNYDSAGNMISRVDHGRNMAKEMAYDSCNRIRQITDPHNGNVKGQYWYDDQGFRVRKKARVEHEGIEKEVETLSPSMYFTVEVDRNPIGQVREDSGYGVNNIYLNGVRVAAVMPNGYAQYYLTDQVDSVKVVTNDSGMVVTSHEYLPFGEDWITEGDTKNAPKYNSQELDKESGYYFYNARHYDPEIGRFVTPDSVIDGELSTQGWNRFAYVHNNPIVYRDPTGHLAVNPYIDKAIKQAEKTGERYKSDALSNYNKDTHSTEVDGIKISFQQGGLANNNTPEKIKKIDQRLWKNLVVAAKYSGIKEIKINAVDYTDPKAIRGNSHSSGTAVDIGEIVDKDGNHHFLKKEYKEKTNSWNSIYNTDPSKIKKFTKEFMDLEGSKRALTPYKMHDNCDKIGHDNRIDTYPDVGTTGSPGMGPSDAYKKWADKHEFSDRVSQSIYTDFQHSHHGHFEVQSDRAFIFINQ